jgi:hypothetical protein
VVENLDFDDARATGRETMGRGTFGAHPAPHTSYLARIMPIWPTTANGARNGMPPEALAIGDVVREAVVRVAEKGVQAASVTAATMRAPAFVRARVERIAFDRPFGAVVLDASGEVPLLIAWQARAPVSPEAAAGERENLPS